MSVFLQQRNKAIGICAAITAYIIYGLNLVGCKDLNNSGLLSPLVLFFFRTTGATILFWSVSLFLPSQKIPPKDLLKLFLASILGISIPQYSTLLGLTMSTPFDASLLNSLKPLWAVIAVFIITKNRPSTKTKVGVIIGILGALMLLFSGSDIVGNNYRTSPVGLIVLSLNGISLAFYLAIFKPLIRKYHPITFLKWSFLFAAILSFPLSVGQVKELDYMALSPKLIAELAFLIVAATFIAFFLAQIGQKNLSPTGYMVCSFFQPITAAIVGTSMGFDIISVEKIIATIMMITSILIINFSKSTEANLSQ